MAIPVKPVTDFINLDDYLAKIPVDSQNRIHDKAKRLSQSIELAKLKPSRRLNGFNN